MYVRRVNRVNRVILLLSQKWPRNDAGKFRETEMPGWNADEQFCTRLRRASEFEDSEMRRRETHVSLFHPATMTKTARRCRWLNERRLLRSGQERRGWWCAPFSNGRDVDADPRVFIQLSNLFNVCIHCALPPRTLSRTQLGFNSAPFHQQTCSYTLYSVGARLRLLRWVETGLTPKDADAN